MKSLNKILAITLLFVLAACSSKSPIDQISSMQKRLDVAENRVEVLYNQDFYCLIDYYKALDTVLPYRKESTEPLELLGAYLQQFETTRPIMQDDIKFSRQQLSDLKDDIQAGLLNEEKTAQYLSDEEAAVRKIEAQIEYFQDRFDEQKKVARSLLK